MIKAGQIIFIQRIYSRLVEAFRNKKRPFCLLPLAFCPLFLILCLLFSCSTTKKLSEGELLYTGVKKIEIETPKKVKLEANQKSSLISPLSYPPNNPLFAPYVRSPFPVGLWVYNWNVKKEKGFKRWLYKNLSKKPVLIANVQPDLRLKMVDNAMKEFGFFYGEAEHKIIPNKRNPKKAKISYRIVLSEPYVYGNISLWRWSVEMDSIVQVYMQRSELKAGKQYDVNVLNQERELISQALRNRGYYYFRPDYIEFLADTTAGHRTINIRVALKQGVPLQALSVYRFRNVEVALADNRNTNRRDTIVQDQVRIVYMQPEILKPDVISRVVKIRPGQIYSASRHDRTLSEFVRLSLFKYTNMTITPVDTNAEKKLDMKIDAEFMLPIETEIELDVSSKSNNLLGPGLIFGIKNKNVFKRAENLSFKLTGTYEWQVGGSNSADANSGLVNSYELGFNADLSVPRLLVPRFIRGKKDRQERTHFQVGTDLLNRHKYFRMISIWGSATYDFNASRRHYHSITPFKLNYTYLLETSHAFDSTVNSNPAVAQSFKNQFIPSVSYSYTYNRIPTYQSPNRLYWQTTLMEAGNLISGTQMLLGNQQKQGKMILNNPYSQFLKATSELVMYKRLNKKDNQLVIRFMGGIGYAYGNSTVMPYSEQFYSGGASSIRAFTIRTIGPGSYHPVTTTSTSYLDQTGDIKLEGNVEYRFRIYDRFQGAFFADAGNVWLVREDEERPGSQFRIDGIWKEIALGCGFGLRYDISYIVIRVDLGVPIHAPYDTGKSGYYNIPKFWNGLVLNLAIGYPF